MHHHHEEMFNGTEAGARFAHYHRLLVDGGGGGGTTTTNKPATTTSADAAERQAQADDKKKTEPPKPTPVEQAKEAVKDGKISTAEKKVVETTPVKDALKGQKETLRESVNKAEGATEHWRDENGKLILDNGKAAPNNMGYWPDTEHEERVQDLTESKDKQSLDALDSQIDALKDAGVTTGLKPLEAQRAARAAEEAKVVDVIEDKESLRGVLEAEKAALESGAPEASENDYQELRADAQKWIDQFNANDGQFYEGNDWFGDDWDDSEVDFDRLAERFHDDPDKLDEFARVQGKEDGDGGDTEADMEAHIADVAKDDPEDARKIALRYQAAQELTEIFRTYTEARDGVEGNADQLEQINAEIGILDESIEQDRAALSQETLDAMDEANKPDTSIIPTETTTPNSSGSPDERDEQGGGTGNGGTDSTGGTEGQGGQGGSGSTTEGTEGQGGNGGTGNGGTGNGGTEGNGGTGNGGTGGTEGTGNGQGSTTEGNGDTPRTREVQIDYTTPERRDQVLQQAREQNLVPAHNTSFNEKGEAVYKVQSGDSYWRIADMSDGKPPHDFDFDHFNKTVNTNSERFGRAPQSGLIHPNEDVVIPGRSLEELIVLMNLPTTEQVEVEEPPYMGRHGGNVPY